MSLAVAGRAGRAARWLLVHPPLLGPAVLGALAGQLGDRGAEVAVPDLRAAVATAPGWPDRYVTGAAGAVDGACDVVVGFSGAGVVLPSIAVATGAVRVIWLDALLPARRGTTEPGEDIRRRVAPLIGADGRIAEWPTWWGPGAFAELVPDAALRAAIEREGHRLPGDFYSVAVPVPGNWPEEGARYVQLSPAYEAQAGEARARGWPVAGGPHGAHLDVAVAAPRVADLLLPG